MASQLLQLQAFLLLPIQLLLMTLLLLLTSLLLPAFQPLLASLTIEDTDVQAVDSIVAVACLPTFSNVPVARFLNVAGSLLMLVSLLHVLLASLLFPWYSLLLPTSLLLSFSLLFLMYLLLLAYHLLLLCCCRLSCCFQHPRCCWDVSAVADVLSWCYRRLCCYFQYGVCICTSQYSIV